MGRDAGVMRRHIIHDMKQFLKKGLGITINKGDGPNSTIIYDKLKFTTDKDNKINGATYKGKKILILKNGAIRYSTDKTKASLVNEFKELLKRADIEHQKTPTPIAEKRAGIDLPQNVMDNIIENVNERLESEIDERVENIYNMEITTNELRELGGVLKPKGSDEVKIKFLEITSKHWKEEAQKKENEGNKAKSELYKFIADVADLKADQIRLRLNQKPLNEEVVNMIEEETDADDLTKFERFKKWARENIVGISAIAISVAGVITTVVMGARNAVKKGGRALGKFAKVVSKMGKKLGPLLSALGTVLSRIISVGSQGLLWLSQNLWILALMITYFIYNEYRTKRKKI